MRGDTFAAVVLLVASATWRAAATCSARTVGFTCAANIRLVAKSSADATPHFLAHATANCATGKVTEKRAIVLFDVFGDFIYVQCFYKLLVARAARSIRGFRRTF